MSLIVPDVTISVCGSLCKYHFLSHSLFCFCSIYFMASHPALVVIIIRKRRKVARKRPNMISLHELLFTEIVKSATNRPDSCVFLAESGKIKVF